MTNKIKTDDLSARETVISRRVFIGAAIYLVSAPVLVTVFNSDNNLLEVIKPGQFFTSEQMTMLVDVAEIMIPKTQTPGATDVHVVPVLDGMMLSWAGEQTKKQFLFVLSQINQLAQKRFKGDYETLSPTERFELINLLDMTAFADTTTETSVAYRKLKQIIYHIYYTSEQVNPDYMLAPGNYRGSATKEDVEKFNAQKRVS